MPATRVMCAMLLGLAAPAVAQQRSPLDALREGQWLEVRGEFEPGTRLFRPRSLELVDPGRYEELVGTIEEYDPQAGRFTLLGQSVAIHPKTAMAGITPDALADARVKVEGYYLGAGGFSAREIRPRGPGRERITGRVDGIRLIQGGAELMIMDLTLQVGPDMVVRHEEDVGNYAVTESRVQAIVDRDRDEENLFGRGIRVTDHVRVAGQVQAAGNWQDNFNLRDRDREDVEESLAAFKGRLIYNPPGRFFAVVGYTVRRLWRDDESQGMTNIRNHRLDESYGYWLDAFAPGLDIQVGRVKFDERREFLYDENLDGPRLIWSRGGFRAELSYTTVLADGSPIDEEAANAILYVSNDDDDRHVAGYLIHREFDFPSPTRRTHAGLRLHGRWLTHHKVWAELAHARGREGPVESRGWALDIGSTWRFHDHFAVTAGYAMATGDDPGSPTDNTFRQTGLQDNNDKFAGVTSFRFYGELVDPELANLEIATVGLGWLPRRRVSLDLVAHRYRQNQASRRLVDMQIDRHPNGINRSLGTEVDLIFGWRTDWKWDLELVAGWFGPGRALDPADDALFGKVQFRYRL